METRFRAAVSANAFSRDWLTVTTDIAHYQRLPAPQAMLTAIQRASSAVRTLV
jgi:hypothetical protein